VYFLPQHSFLNCWWGVLKTATLTNILAHLASCCAGSCHHLPLWVEPWKTEPTKLDATTGHLTASETMSHPAQACNGGPEHTAWKYLR
jgi:hypothetical protein